MIEVFQHWHLHKCSKKSSWEKYYELHWEERMKEIQRKRERNEM